MHVNMLAAGRWRRISLFAGQCMATNRAGNIVSQPWNDAVSMINAIAWHFLCLGSYLELAQGDGAMRIINQVPGVHRNYGNQNSRTWDYTSLSRGLRAGTKTWGAGIEYVTTSLVPLKPLPQVRQIMGFTLHSSEKQLHVHRGYRYLSLNPISAFCIIDT